MFSDEKGMWPTWAVPTTTLSHVNGIRFVRADYDLTTDVYETSSARQAYLLECRLFHRHDPIDNEIHPRVPAGTNWRCPVRGLPLVVIKAVSESPRED